MHKNVEHVYYLMNAVFIFLGQIAFPSQKGGDIGQK